MSVEVLREAASLMRERAEAASADGPWTAGTYADGAAVLAESGDVWIAKTGYTSDAVADADHIASWHPAVALAVADWLDDVVERGEAEMDEGKAALTVARAYLGEQQ